MAQTLSNSAQTPATPSRQRGIARGQRRTPASRTKKPYARPSVVKAEALKTGYESDSSSGFIKGMRSLIHRLWGTSLKSSTTDAGPESSFSQNEIPKPTVTAAFNEDEAAAMQSDESAFATISSTSVVGDNAETPDVSRRAATVSGRTRARRPTAESLFVPSPFAYNKRLATATPSVANLRNVDRVKDQLPELSRRHSVGRLDSRRPKLSTGTYSSVSYMGTLESAGDTLPARHMSSSDARRLLNTIHLINTPILEARNRPAAAHMASMGDPMYEHLADAPATISHASSAMPFRRLPLSLLALSDTPEKAPRVPKVDASNILDRDALRRSMSLTNTSRIKSKAPSLARTIQLQQARKAVAERLIRDKTASVSHENNAESEFYDAAEAGPSRRDDKVSAVQNAGTVHGRDEVGESEESRPHKRRHLESGEAAGVNIDEEIGEDEGNKAKSRARNKRSSKGRRVMSFGRALSAASDNVRWRFSARFEPLSDDLSDSNSESDDDREAIASKVPISKIRGGELIGLSLHPTTSSVSASSTGTGLPTVRSTGFGGTRTPIPINGETGDAAKPVSRHTTSTLSTVGSKDAATPKALHSIGTTGSASAVSTEKSTAAASVSSVPNLFDDLAANPKKEIDENKSETEAKATVSSSAPKPASSSSLESAKPVFSFGTTANTTGEAKAPLFSVLESKPATSALPSFGKKTDPSTFGESSKSEESSSKPALAFSFGAKPDSSKISASDEPEATDISEKAVDASSVSDMDASKAKESLPKFSFSLGSSKTADANASSTKETTPSFGFKGAGAEDSTSGFSFGLKTTPKPETSSTTVPAITASEGVSKPVFGFGFSTSDNGSVAADALAANAEKKEAPKANTSFNIFGAAADNAAASAKESPFAATSSGDKKVENEAAAKPLFSFEAAKGTIANSSEDRGDSGSGGVGTSVTPSFAFSVKPDSTKRTADDKPESGGGLESKGVQFGFKPSGGGFSFGKTSETTSAASTAPGIFTFGTNSTSSAAASTTSLLSFSAAAPAKTIDLTSSAAATHPGINLTSKITSSSASTPNMFSSFGKSTATAAPSVAGTGGSAMDSSMTDDSSKTAQQPQPGFEGFGAKTFFGEFGAPGATTTAPLSKPAAFDSLNRQNPSSSEDRNAKKPAFTFGLANTPSAASFESATVPTPAVGSFGLATSSAAMPVHSFGAPATTPSAFNFGVASSPAVTPSATPATLGFSFGNNKTLQLSSMSKPPTIGMSGAAQSSNANSGTFGFGSSQTTGNNAPASNFGGGFGSSSASAPNNGFGSSSMPGFGSAVNTGGAPAPSNSGFGGASSGGFNFSSNVSTTSGFGGGGQPSGGFGQQSNVSTSSAFNAQPSSGFGQSGANSGFGVGSNTSMFGAGASSAASSAAPQFSFGQNTGSSAGGFQFGAGGSSAFDGNSSVANSTPTTPFVFGSNTSLQGGSHSGSFQFTAGANQQSNTGVGGMTLGRVAGGSNVSTSSHGGRRIARPRTRRPH
ncbi:hypothetical protein IWW48_006177 [Coemansia sp. RSA 1200]|nr:hypothetical protein IWW48_006177 [Coemansia sp. RSA 1200]